MLEAIQLLDRQALTWIEQNVQSPWLDGPMRVMSSSSLFLPVFIALWVVLVWRGGALGRRLALVALVLVLVSDQLSSSVLKPLIARPRPNGSSSFSFPSSHAANITAQALLFARFYPRLGVPLGCIAAVVCFSRVYLEKHFPTDVLGGALIGAILGVVAIACAQRYGPRIDALWERLSRIRSQRSA